MSKGKQPDTGSSSTLDSVMPVISSLLDQGTRAFALSDWPQAIDSFGEMSQITEQVFGPESPRYADALVMYGRALLQNAIEQTALMAQKTLAQAVTGQTFSDNEQEESEDDNRELGSSSKGGRIAFEGEPDFRQLNNPEGQEEEEQEDGDEGEAEGEGEGEDDDFSAAWDVLDTARLIQSKQTDRKSQLKYAETLMLLGDVSMESENFPQAQQDFTAALHVKRLYLEADDRELAELHYKVALALEYNEDTEGALVEMAEVEKILARRLDVAELEEQEGLREVLEDVRVKIEEWRNPVKQQDDVVLDDEMKEKARAAFLVAVEGGKVNDLTALVKKKKNGDSKRKCLEDDAGSNEDTESCAKKLKD
ncbi:hypothetical protein BX661DRAFT_181133 [Kickxella alabastrina]|uniref:uncharacterized protein n=1 Tax=Kickxella alabastrina TaxID=61397 RepID=UPI0022205579|nr:uncharacterized protein BX661DRAFT_181133 [Kickxella alabastrina]KAI7830124.1 hypothetical protein BX661DRAFT_181133 [Kickxella alabastrina]